MHRQPLLQLLYQHSPADPNEQTMSQATIAFVEQYPDCFERSLLIGHVTGSAWIVSPDRTQTLLIHHRKLDRWLQPGGHADGDPDVAAVALREAQEETGLTSLRLLKPAVFDVDVHQIPARNEVPEHLHYDIRFLLEADLNEPFGLSDEIKNIQWFSLEKAKTITDSESILRLIRKNIS
ncbi:NUDIX domain-containing protein [Spirosoma sp. HMF4905]|uniref:NUDIX domain-containing protein n=1 Tax=Spirosoma arboris TaxID=2682092 RepID=A0A7K1SKH2_9BACT|nr:NUDIX hydrolase [Spirosoma arboris]MVM34275.1 NUDIX domain-containing protein [Spirosoma arboris]